MDFSFANLIGRFSLTRILLLAFIFRVVASVFSEGYAMYDDHFLIIEVAQSWVDGKNVGDWLPNKAQGITEPKEHNLFYTGIHYLLFKAMHNVGLNDPKAKMLFIRLVHAFYSLLVVYYGYKIALVLAGEECARYTGLLLAMLWFMPNLSVRNLVEMVCIPPLLAGIWILLRDNMDVLKKFLLAGFVSAFAFDIRYQTALFLVGIIMVLLLQRKWLGAIFFGLGCVINVLLFQVTIDCYFWGYPFAEFIAYAKFNLAHRNECITGYWFNYPLLITGLVLPPLSLMFWYGYFTTARKYLMLFLPSFLFLVFHCYFPNKQERFILPFIPIFIIQGNLGWYTFQRSSAFWQIHKLLLNRMLLLVAVVNFILLIICSVASTKTSRMDSMYYLYQRGDSHGFIVEATYQGSAFEDFPRYYAAKWDNDYVLNSNYGAAELKNQLRDSSAYPNYVIFLSDNNLYARIAKFRQSYPDIAQLNTIQPSFIDRLFHRLNPVNENEPCYIFSLKRPTD